ncbi:nucleotidyltransferase domain-containing protein [Aromatoleum sp.]|uniref:nucleotidyltransferase domain-containing protein n=1 Tax=Aromatoleum sp. TaxID=2307007 RepID=UPI002FC75C7B
MNDVRSQSAHLIRSLNDPSRTDGLTPPGWTALIRAARAANVLGLLAERLRAVGLVAPAAPQRHLDAALQLGQRQIRSVRWEAHALQRALDPLRIPVVLLKGAAYAMAGHAVSRGRLFGDIDILVPRSAIGDVELRLMVAGWASAKSDAYDQRYYRRWMHELPPMVNVRRGTVLDVHHTILPLTSRHTPDAARILRETEALPGLPGIRVPRPTHLLIHSIVHLLHEGELHNGLRDLFDIDGLIRAFGDDAFWMKVVEASRELDLARPVHSGLRLAHRVIGTPVPPEVFARFENADAGRRTSPGLQLLYRQALQRGVEEKTGLLPELAAFGIYVRAHWLRMPPHLLLRHLAYKAMMRLKNDEPALAGRA